MSGVFKFTTVQGAENAVNRLYDQLQAARHHTKLEIERARREAAENARRVAAQEAQWATQNLELRINSTINSVNENIRRVDEQQRRRLSQLANEVQQAISKVDSDLRNDMRSMDKRLRTEIANVAKRVDDGLRAQQKQLDSHQQQLDDLATVVGSILDHIAETSQRRKEAVTIAKGAKDAAFSRTEITRFCPDEARKIEERMKALEANTNDEATASRAAEVLLQVQFAEEEAMKRKMIYDAVLRSANEQLSTVLGEVNSNRSTEISLPDDPQAVTTIETDFWSRGAYDEAARRLQQLKAELATQPSLERIAEIAEEIATIEVKANQMVEDAARKAILSENRITVTEDIVDALLKQGWQLERNPDGSDSLGYLGGEIDHDWREGVYAVISSMNGERISIVVRPDDDDLQNQIIFHRNDDRQVTDLDYRRSLQRIKEQIQKSGHRLGEITVPEGGGDNKVEILTSAPEMGRRGAAAQINKEVRKRR